MRARMEGTMRGRAPALTVARGSPIVNSLLRRVARREHDSVSADANRHPVDENELGITRAIRGSLLGAVGVGWLVISAPRRSP